MLTMFIPHATLAVIFLIFFLWTEVVMSVLKKKIAVCSSPSSKLFRCLSGYHT